MSMRLMSVLLVLFAGIGSVAAQVEATPSKETATTPVTSEVVKSRFEIEKADFERVVNKDLTTEKVRRRVPDGFGSASNSQKEKVYKIQADYHELIASLQVRIALLEKEMLEKQEEVLTADQRVALKKFRDDLAARRRATATTRRGGDAATEPADEPK